VHCFGHSGGGGGAGGMGLPISPVLSNYKIFEQIPKHNPNSKGSILLKNCQLVYSFILDPILQAVLKNGGCYQST